MVFFVHSLEILTAFLLEICQSYDLFAEKNMLVGCV